MPAHPPRHDVAVGALPAGPGVGYKPQHFAAITAAAQPLAFFEVHAENYMGDGGRPHADLTRLHQDYAVSIHGVGLGLGGSAPLDAAHLARLVRLCDRHQPERFSEHLAWAGHDGLFLNDLLPLPYTPERLDQVVAHVDQLQEALRRQILLENPATYLTFAESTIPEPEFLGEIARRTGCGLLLDVNNLFVSATNHALSPQALLRAFPLAPVGEIHLAGHASATSAGPAPLLLDAHGGVVADPVWALFETVIARTGPLPTLIEWDNDVPAWPVLRAEAERAGAVLARCRKAA
ncbi:MULTISPECIES: MNIO family bufferin maturase [unclassified Xanthobacter]|uniref:MNIO family bufferin maturase n=1 Tax=unclassified Xanthobacter TaxID=2623496 RepID=UPI001EDDB968|nr:MULTISPECIES: DUF692 domain-containing protein [unclassified Xanthobacter]